jgi:hypothetical protein
MSGEAKQIFSEVGTDSVSWAPAGAAATDSVTANAWYRARFDLPPSSQQRLLRGPPAPPAQLAHALKLPAGSVNKVGLACIVALYYRSSAVCHTHEHIRCLCF